MLQLHTPDQAAHWLRERVRGTLQTDSRVLQAGDGLIVWPGAAIDGRKFVASALDAGAAACLVEHADVEAFGFADERVASYSQLKSACGPIAALYCDAPSQQLDMVAVTGTNGKTSTAWWLAQALGRLGRPCGVVGTLGVGAPGALQVNGLTTPDPILLQQQLRHFVNQGLTACALEASSIGLAENRLDATRFKVAVFTNLTQDHLDYHHGMADYWAAKQRLFSWPGLQAAVINIDDPHGSALCAELNRSGLDVWSVSCTAPARLQAQNIATDAQGMHFDVVEGDVRHHLSTRMLGAYNVSNLLGVLGALRALHVPLADALLACAELQSVPGRMESVDALTGPLTVVDYAHSPDALEKALGALRPLATQREGRLWCVFGCGGDRDTGKRPLMGAAAERYADQLVVTSDNPRTEDPSHIIRQITQGLSAPSAAMMEPDRAQAIAYALRTAQPQDVVLIAGKGHENYQEVHGLRSFFSDRQCAEQVLQQLGAAQTQGGLA